MNWKAVLVALTGVVLLTAGGFAGVYYFVDGDDAGDERTITTVEPDDDVTPLPPESLTPPNGSTSPGTDEGNGTSTPAETAAGTDADTATEAGADTAAGTATGSTGTDAGRGQPA